MLFMQSFLKPVGVDNFVEHHNHPYGEDVSAKLVGINIDDIHFNKDKKRACVRFQYTDKKIYLYTSYYVGLDWIVDNEMAIYVEPKLNVTGKQTDYLGMLFSALTYPEAAKEIDKLYDIKWVKPPISIDRQKDLLTPLLVVIYLKLVKEIVRKGLKKSYYKVESNLYSRVKGKVMIGKTIKENVFKNKPLHTCCTYDEFGYNGLENRLLNKALGFIKRYLPTIKNLNTDKYTTEIFNYINPAFNGISEEVNMHDILHTKNNAFYKEYAEAIKLAKIILQRFGYNINNTSSQTISTPPFWIDMTKLFEFYILGQLKDAGLEVEYQFKAYKDEPDFLIRKEKLIVDAKYKTYYEDNKISDEIITDIRQISGYARNINIRNFLGIVKDTDDTQPSLLIIYPNQQHQNKIESGTLYDQGTDIIGYYKIRKISIDLPVIESIQCSYSSLGIIKNLKYCRLNYPN